MMAKSGERTLIDQSIRAPFLKVNPDNTFAIRTKNASGDVESIFYIDTDWRCCQQSIG